MLAADLLEVELAPAPELVPVPLSELERVLFPKPGTPEEMAVPLPLPVPVGRGKIPVLLAVRELTKEFNPEAAEDTAPVILAEGVGRIPPELEFVMEAIPGATGIEAEADEEEPCAVIIKINKLVVFKKESLKKKTREEFERKERD